MKFERGGGNVFADLGSSDAEANAAADANWQAFQAIEIAPHPKLSDTQKRLGLEMDPSARLPQDQQIISLNQSAQIAPSGSL